MRIVFLAVDDEFAGTMQKYLYERHPEWIVGSIISTCAIYKKSKLGAAMFIIKNSGFYYLLQMIRIKILRNFLIYNKKKTPSTLAQKQNVDIFWCKNINNDICLRRLHDWNPDIVISTNFNQFAGKRARDIALIGTWNLHKSYLPHYRGMAPCFFALLNGEKTVGVTLHAMDNGFDTGPIISQVKVPVQEGDTVYELNQRTSEVGGKLLAEFLENFNSNSINPSPQHSGNWRNYSYPTRRNIREFRKKKLKFYKYS